MAEFSGKIVDAYYFSEDYTMIEVIYKNENDEMVSYVMEANPEHSDMQALEGDGWSVIKLAEATAEYKRQQANAFSEAINIQVQERLKEVIETTFKTFKEKKNDLKKIEQQLRQQQKILDDEVYNLILKQNNDNDYLFKFKLWALEQDFVKSASNQVKSDLRKCKSLFEGISVLHHVLTKHDTRAE
jgi:hypothetical protein